MTELVAMVCVVGLVVFGVVAVLRGMRLKFKADREGVVVECD